jgi:hypothetical protein
MGVQVERRPVLFRENVDARKDLSVGDDLDVTDDLTVGGQQSAGSDAGETPAGAITPETGVAITSQRRAPMQHVVLTLTDVLVAVAAADDFGSALLGTFPDKNIRLVASEVDLLLTKDGVEIAEATNLTAAIGTVAAEDTTLDTTESNIGSATALTADEDPAVYQAFTLADLDLGDAADNEIYLNVASADISSDGSVTANGTIDLYYYDLGNVTS